MPNACFKDSLRLPTKNSAVLMTVISVGNSLQQGVNFGHFVDAVNQEFKKGTLEKLIIVTTGYLQRHYFSLGLENPLDKKTLEENAAAMDQAWFNNNDHYLKQLKLPIEKKNWKEVLELEPVGEFTDFLQKLKNHYQENKSFKKAVTKHTRHYVTRKINQYLAENGRKIEFDDFMKVAVDYILEELAGYVQLKKCGADFFTYPGSMNPPACHVSKHFVKETAFKYIEYEIGEFKKAPTLFFQPSTVSAQYAQWSLNRVQWNIPQQFLFVREFNRLISNINTLPEQNEPITSATKITHRRSV